MLKHRSQFFNRMVTTMHADQDPGFYFSDSDQHFIKGQVWFRSEYSDL